MLVSNVKRNVVTMFLFVYMGFFAISAGAGIEDRPISTDDAYTLDKGVFTVSIGSAFVKADNGGREVGLNLDLGYGITDRLEFTVDVPTVVGGDGEQGLGDIGFRPELFVLAEQGYIPAVSFAAMLKTASGDANDGLGSGQNDYSLTLQLSKALSALTFHFNVGYTFVGQPEGETADDAASYNLALEYGFGTLTLVGEVTGEASSGSNELAGLVGFVYEVNDSIALDLAGFTAGSEDLKLTGGLTYQF